MAKITGPLFSLTARGTIADALTYSVWRGIQYVRTRVIPANPNTADQQEVRGVFQTLNNIWNRASTLFRAVWTAAAVGNPVTNRNLLIRENVPVLQGQAALTNFVFSPGMGGALPPLTAVSSDGGAQVLCITCTQPTLPTGWTQQSVVGAALLQGDPSPELVRTPYEAEDAAAPFTIVNITVIAGTWVWGVWNRLVAPDLSVRYSLALSGTQVIA